MKINLNKSDKEKLNNLININNNNIKASEMMFYLLNNIDAYTSDNVNKYKENYECDEIEALFHLSIDILELNYSDKENIEFLDTYLKDAFKKEDINKYINNIYNKNIKISPHKEKDYQLVEDHYHAYEIFPLTDITYKDNYIEQTKLSYFDKRYNFIALNYNKSTWMSITPNEINTMEDDINKVSGDILVLGLGLGYYPYMISNKSDVNSITIIEKDKKIIEIFNKELINKFNYKNKIKIINADAKDYINKLNKHYDYIYIDLWHNPEDGLPLYIYFKKLEHKLINTKVLYWLEKGIIAYLRRLVIILMEETINNVNESNYKYFKTEEDKIINNLYYKTKSLTINSYNDVESLLKDDNLIRLIKE